MPFAVRPTHVGVEQISFAAVTSDHRGILNRSRKDLHSSGTVCPDEYCCGVGRIQVSEELNIGRWLFRIPLDPEGDGPAVQSVVCIRKAIEGRIKPGSVS